MRYAALVLILTSCTIGCSNQDFGHTRVADTTVIKDVGVDPVTAETQRKKRENMLLDLRKWQTSTTPGLNSYLMGPDDRLTIEILSLEKPGESSSLSRTVATDGTATLPLVGKINLAGLTVSKAEERITRAYDGRYIRNAQTSVEIVEHRSVNIVVTGSVANPGHYNLKKNAIPLLDMLAMAGGVKEDAGSDIFITRQIPFEAEDGEIAYRPKMLQLDRTAFSDSGITEINVPIIDNDVITIPSRISEVIYVLGYVGRPGAYPLRRAANVDAMRAVAMAGGLSASARAENSYMIRRTSDGQMIRPLDLKKISGGDEPAVYLQPGDTLVVGTSMIAKLSEFVKPSVTAGYDVSPLP